jgi:hypothetical protein
MSGTSLTSRTALALGAMLTITASGCVVVPEPPPEPVRVEFVNETGLDLTPNFYYSDTAADAAGLFVVAHLNTSFIEREFKELRPRETEFTVLECDQVRSLGVRRPRLFAAGTLEVVDSEDEIFLLRETDFECGATIRFIYYVENGVFRVRLEIA